MEGRRRGGERGSIQKCLQGPSGRQGGEEKKGESKGNPKHLRTWSKISPGDEKRNGGWYTIEETVKGGGEEKHERKLSEVLFKETKGRTEEKRGQTITHWAQKEQDQGGTISRGRNHLGEPNCRVEKARLKSRVGRKQYIQGSTPSIPRVKTRESKQKFKPRASTRGLIRNGGKAN